MSILVEVCHCSHDRDSHYEHRHTCLAMLCDCQTYTHRDDPKPVIKPAPRPAKAAPVDLPTPVLPHAMWCTCPACLAIWGIPSP